MASFISNSEFDTGNFAREIGRQAKPGDVVALTGELGAGKTAFVKGFVAGVGSDAAVTSPTFTLVHEYGGGRCPIYHFDFYRIESAEAALQLGLDDYLFGGGVTVIEWADRFRELLPPSASWFAIENNGASSRIIHGLTNR